MKVLHLPANIASQVSVTVRALRDIEIDARGLVKRIHLMEDTGGIESLPSITANRYSLNRVFQKIRLWRMVLDAIKWADVIHWHYRGSILPMEFDLRYAASLNKARIVEFWGSDIRIPEIASIDNPYIAQMYQAHPELAEDRRKKSLEIQRLFAHYGFECLVPDFDMESYIQKDIWPSPYRSKQRLIISDFDPKYPDPEEKHPLIVHAPSDKALKGTETVLRSTAQLKSTYDFEFKLIHGLEHHKALEIMRNSDIMIDELNTGAYGLAALEAMSLGKPTICYIKPALVQTYPSGLPIVNANHENITRVLADLLQDGKKRHEIGHQSRLYVEKHHDAHMIAQDLVIIYKELLAKNAKV